MHSSTDFVVIGAGIAGASAAYFLAQQGHRVTLLERESQPGYHSTSRSAAMFMECYGNDQVRALTRASRAFLNHPPAGFTEYPLLQPRGCLTVAAPENVNRLPEVWNTLRPYAPNLQQLTTEQACTKVPVLRPERVAGAIYDPDAADLDANALHQGFLRGARQQGAQLVCDADVTAAHYQSDQWHITTASGHTYSSPVVLNAAGAWADIVAELAGVPPIGLQPCRRSAFTLNAPEDYDIHTWPMVDDINEQWYFKPDAGQLLASPANVDPVHPHDVQPEEIDIATGIWHLEENTTLHIRRPTHTWAGLRSFVSDKSLVCGFAPDAPGFFWVAGQGGYGIQTSVAMGMASAALASGQPLPDNLVHEGLTVAALSPARLLES